MCIGLIRIRLGVSTHKRHALMSKYRIFMLIKLSYSFRVDPITSIVLNIYMGNGMFTCTHSYIIYYFNLPLQGSWNSSIWTLVRSNANYWHT